MTSAAQLSEQLQHYTHEELVALVRDFLADLNEDQQIRFLNMITQGPRPMAFTSPTQNPQRRCARIWMQ